MCEQSLSKVLILMNENCLRYRLHKPDTPKHSRWRTCPSSIPLKYNKILIKCEQNRGCTSSMRKQPFGKI